MVSNLSQGGQRGGAEISSPVHMWLVFMVTGSCAVAVYGPLCVSPRGTNTPITQESPRVFKVLCQKLGAEVQVYSLYSIRTGQLRSSSVRSRKEKRIEDK